MRKWPVIACDQFTQDRDYWEKVKNAAADAPSTINLIFPEVFLSDNDAAQRIAGIHSTMKRYLADGVFEEPRQGFVYIERDTPWQKKRRGLVAAVDLEHYDWHPHARPLIRSTEGTVPERLPPRMDIRRGAPLELPHVLLLIDDEADSLLPALGEKVKNTAPCYKTDLMMNSGSIAGWFLGAQDDALSLITEKFEELHRRSSSRYGGPFLFAVGDGNHSLAAAKGIWEEYKAAHGSLLRLPDSFKFHPCRYALVEIENIYDPAIQFEPIHRVIFDAGFDKAVSLLSQLPGFSCRAVDSRGKLSRLCKQSSAANCFGLVSRGRYALIGTSAAGIATACLQLLLDDFAGGYPQLIDYIHDEDEVFRLADGNDADTRRQAVGILLPPVQKSGLFETVARAGPLPRKSFSMGHSSEKRFYLECRSLE